MVGERICPKCGMPFKWRVFGVNLLTVRLERCPHCHKFVNVRAPYVPKDEEAEGKREVGMSEEDMMRRRINESKEER